MPSFHLKGTHCLCFWALQYSSALQVEQEPEYSFISGKLLPPAVEQGEGAGEGKLQNSVHSL